LTKKKCTVPRQPDQIDDVLLGLMRNHTVCVECGIKEADGRRRKKSMPAGEREEREKRRDERK